MERVASSSAAGPARIAFVTRRRAARAAARRRAAARVARPLAGGQERGGAPAENPPAGLRLAGTVAFFLASIAAHGMVVGAGVLASGLTPLPSPERQTVAIEIREPPPEPAPAEPEPEAPEPEPEAPEPEPERRPDPEPKPPPREPAPAEPEPDPEPPRPKPRRVVGLDMESTVEGGEGPAFATGNTRGGQTRSRAADPEKVDPAGATGSEEGPEEAASPNRRAAHIPTAGGKIELPKRKKPVVPDYPPELEAQGIEANVPVLVSIDAKGVVTEVKILKEPPQSAFVESARRAALAESFSPATRDGTPIPYTLSYTYRFRVKE